MMSCHYGPLNYEPITRTCHANYFLKTKTGRTVPYNTDRYHRLIFKFLKKDLAARWRKTFFRGLGVISRVISVGQWVFHIMWGLIIEKSFGMAIPTYNPSLWGYSNKYFCSYNRSKSDSKKKFECLGKFKLLTNRSELDSCHENWLYNVRYTIYNQK